MFAIVLMIDDLKVISMLDSQQVKSHVRSERRGCWSEFFAFVILSGRYAGHFGSKFPHW